MCYVWDLGKDVGDDIIIIIIIITLLLLCYF